MIGRFARNGSGLLLLSTLACGGGTQFKPVEIGDQVPEFGAPIVGTADTVRLADLRGAPLMLNIWATWCPPCRKEMPELQELYETYEGAGFEMVGVSIDGPGLADQIHDLTSDLGVTYTILHDDAGEVTVAFSTIGAPETFLIDAEGVVTARWIGQFLPMAEDVQNKVRQLLGMDLLTGGD